MTVHTCNNCRKIFTGKYCSNCGQDAHVGKLDMHSLLHEAWHGLTHTDKGLLKLIIELAKRPGKTYSDYFAGARKKYFSPVVFFLISFGALLLINEWVSDYEDYRYHTLNEIQRYIQHAAKLKALVLLPIQVAFTWLLFFRRYNLAQIIVFWLYCIGFTNVAAIVLAVFRFAFIHHHGLVEVLIRWIQYVIVVIHFFAVFGRGTVNKISCVAVLFLLLVAGVYADYYTVNEVGIDTDYPSFWEAVKEIFSFR